MRQTITRRSLLASGLLSVLAACAYAQEATAIGTVTFQAGDVRLERSGRTTALAKGQQLMVGDRLLTGPDGHVHARMVDNGFISVRPSARFHIQAYTYAPQDPGANRVGLLLESGVARTISGKAGEAARQHYRFNTPVAAIGLRGTDYVVQALPDATRVSVLKGAVTLSAYGPGCQSGNLDPCTGALVRELAASSPHAYMEVRAQGGLPVIVPPGNGKDAPDKAVPPRPEEFSASAERQLTSALATDVLRNSGSTAQRPQAQAQAGAQPPPEIVWGRWSSVALPGTPTLASLKTDDREITFGNALFGLLRPAGTPQLPSAGVIGMNYTQGEAYLQSAQPGQSPTLTPATLSNGALQLDFNNRQFSTRLDATAQGNTYALQAQGAIQFQGMLQADPARSSMSLAGTLSSNANEAGYLFQAGVAPNDTLIGATRWSR